MNNLTQDQEVLTGYTILDQNLNPVKSDDQTKEVRKGPFSFNVEPISNSLSKRLQEIDQERIVSLGLAKLKRAKSILQSLPVISNPEFTLTVAQWDNYEHIKGLDVRVIGRQGNYLALQTLFQ